MILHLGLVPQASKPWAGCGFLSAQHPYPFAGQLRGLHLNDISRIEIQFLAQAYRKGRLAFAG
jgi:hypothetical protein